MTKTQFLKKLMKAVEAELFSDSNISKSVETGRAKGETDEQLILRALKVRKGSPKSLKFMEKHKFTIDIDFSVISKDGLEPENKVVEEVAPVQEPVEEIINTTPEAAAIESISDDEIKERVKVTFIREVEKQFASDSTMITALQRSSKAAESLDETIKRILKTRKNSARTKNIALDLGMKIDFDSINFKIHIKDVKAQEILDLISKQSKINEIITEAKKQSTFTYFYDQNIPVFSKSTYTLMDVILDIEKVFANDSIIQKAILTEVSKGSKDADIVIRCFKTRHVSAKMYNLAREYNLYLATTGSGSLLLMSSSEVVSNLILTTEYVDSKSSSKSTGKTMQDYDKEKKTGTRVNTFTETKKADDLKQEVYGNIIADMFDKDALPYISEQLNEIFKSDSVVKKSLLVAEKNKEGLTGKVLRAKKIRPSSKLLKELLDKIKANIDALDDFKFNNIEFIKSEDAATKAGTLDDGIKYQINATSITIYEPNGDVHNASKSHPEFFFIKKCLEEKNFKDALLAICKVKQVEEHLETLNEAETFGGTNKTVILKNKRLLIVDNISNEESELNGMFAQFIISLSSSGSENYQYALKFMIKMVENNMDETSMDGLFKFLQNARIPINHNGNILTYKLINSNYTDCYTGKIDNSIGKTVSMERSKVTYNPQQTCAAGLHVCSYSYLSHYNGNRIVICEVEPHNVVSVPIDYHFAKMRCCQYTVIEEVPRNTGDVLAKRENSFYMK